MESKRNHSSLTEADLSKKKFNPDLYSSLLIQIESVLASLYFVEYRVSTDKLTLVVRMSCRKVKGSTL